MFLLHRRLSGVDGFADAAQLGGEERRGVNLRSWFSTYMTSNTRNQKLNIEQESNT